MVRSCVRLCATMRSSWLRDVESQEIDLEKPRAPRLLLTSGEGQRLWTAPEAGRGALLRRRSPSDRGFAQLRGRCRTHGCPARPARVPRPHLTEESGCLPPSGRTGSARSRWKGPVTRAQARPPNPAGDRSPPRPLTRAMLGGPRGGAKMGGPHPATPALPAPLQVGPGEAIKGPSSEPPWWGRGVQDVGHGVAAAFARQAGHRPGTGDRGCLVLSRIGPIPLSPPQLDS